MASIFDNLGEGMLRLGGGYLGQRMAARRAESDLRRAQGPLFDPMMNMAGQSLSLAQGMDPNKVAAERFAQQQALMEPGNELQRQQLMRQLHAKGLLGVASYAPVPGTVATPGVAMNSQMAALLAAQEGARSQSAYDSLREGNLQLDNLLRRSGMLQQGAQQARNSGQLSRQYMPSKPSIAETLLKGGMNILQDPKARGTVGGMLGDVGNWLGLSGPDMSWYSPDQWSGSGF